MKGWKFSGELLPDSEKDTTRVLGVLWNPESDQISYEITQSIPKAIPQILNRRIALELVMKVYDPLGFLSPFMVQGKMLLRETWELKLGWDDALPHSLYEKWVQFLQEMATLRELKYDRCLQPENSQGQPMLIIMSDASEKAYGCACYIRWQLTDGTFWCRLILAKTRIAPTRRLTTPQLELNAAVLYKHARAVIEKEMRLEFHKTYHLLDSATVLGMIKQSTRFKLYEGVRVSEIQCHTDGDMTEWHWVSGKTNAADWVSRGISPEGIASDSQWWLGPSFLSKSESKSDIKSCKELAPKDVTLPGERKLALSVHTATIRPTDTATINYRNFGSAKKLQWTLARVFAIA